MLINGCTSTYRLYQGPKRTKSKVAILQVDNNIKLTSIIGPEINEGYINEKYIEFLPGSYTIRVSFSMVDSIFLIQSTSDKVVLFNAEAGHTYKLKYKYKPHVGWYVWIEDSSKIKKSN